MTSIPQWEVIQSLAMLFLVISGAYLFFLPYWTKRKRNQRRNVGVEAIQTAIMKEKTV